MNDEQEATWLVIHAKVCAILPYRLLEKKFLLLNKEEAKLLQEQMPKLLKVNKE